MLSFRMTIWYDFPKREEGGGGINGAIQRIALDTASGTRGRSGAKWKGTYCINFRYCLTCIYTYFSSIRIDFRDYRNCIWCKGTASWEENTSNRGIDFKYCRYLYQRLTTSLRCDCCVVITQLTRLLIPPIKHGIDIWPKALTTTAGAWGSFSQNRVEKYK